MKGFFGATDGQIIAALQQLNLSPSTIASHPAVGLRGWPGCPTTLSKSIGASGSAVLDQIVEFFNKRGRLAVDTPAVLGAPAARRPRQLTGAEHRRDPVGLRLQARPAVECPAHRRRLCRDRQPEQRPPPGAGLVQYPCFGGANQQWYLSVDQGNSDISGQGASPSVSGVYGVLLIP